MYDDDGNSYAETDKDILFYQRLIQLKRIENEMKKNGESTDIFKNFRIRLMQDYIEY